MLMQLDGTNLSELLAQAREEYGDGVQIVKADRIRTGGVAGFFSKEKYQLTIDVPTRAATSVPESILDLAEEVSNRERDAAPFAPLAASPGPTMSTDSPSFASVLADITATIEEQPSKPSPTLATAVSEPLPCVQQPPGVRNPVVRVTAPDRATHGKSLPALINPVFNGGSSEVSLRALVGALKELPPLPSLPDEPGSLIAVVGYDASRAWKSALSLADRIGVPEMNLNLAARSNDIRVHASRRFDTVEAARARAEKWSRRTSASIVVVEATMGPASTGWTREILAALEPDAIWAVVSATSKTHDASAWIERLPACHAVMVTDVMASADPASVLEIGRPVATLDGAPATPGAWASVIVEHLLEAA
jgi:hypothetical protein